MAAAAGVVAKPVGGRRHRGVAGRQAARCLERRPSLANLERVGKGRLGQVPWRASLDEGSGIIQIGSKEVSHPQQQATRMETAADLSRLRNLF